MQVVKYSTQLLKILYIIWISLKTCLYQVLYIEMRHVIIWCNAKLGATGLLIAN